jgi:hypothetical protein
MVTIQVRLTPIWAEGTKNWVELTVRHSKNGILIHIFEKGHISK